MDEILYHQPGIKPSQQRPPEVTHPGCAPPGSQPPTRCAYDYRGLGHCIFALFTQAGFPPSRCRVGQAHKGNPPPPLRRSDRGAFFSLGRESCGSGRPGPHARTTVMAWAHAPGPGPGVSEQNNPQLFGPSGC